MKLTAKYKQLKKSQKIAVTAVASVLILSIIGTALYLIIPLNLKIDWDSVTPIEHNVVLFDKGEYGDTKALAKVDEAGNLTDEPFKILSFTDTHLDTYRKKTAVTMQMLINNIKREKPDLVVFVGDTITSSNNRGRLKQLGSVMEKFGVYWTLTFGNHEGDNARSVSRKKMAELFASYPHCLIECDVKTTSTGETVWGYSNHSVNILKADGSVRQSLIFVDGGNRVSKSDAKLLNIDKDSYDFVKPSQIKWYEDTVDALAPGTKSMLFVHIPLNEYQIAYDMALEGNEDVILEYGNAYEKVACSQYNSGLFTSILNKASTQAVVAGHDHINDFRIKYQGIYLIYNQPSGYSSYNLVSKKKSDTLIKGCSIYTVAADGGITFDQIKNVELYDHTEILKLYQ